MLATAEHPPLEQIISLLNGAADPAEKWQFEDDEERRQAIEAVAERRAEMVESIASIYRPPSPPEPAKPVDLSPLADALDNLGNSIETIAKAISLRKITAQVSPESAPEASRPMRSMNWIAYSVGWIMVTAFASMVYLTETHPDFLMALIKR